MNKTKIEWCDSTWNPVTGCYHDCEYCYARKIATRFAGLGCFSDENIIKQIKVGDKLIHEVYMPEYRYTKSGKYQKALYSYGFEPTFHRYRLDEPQKKTKPQTIFVCSMADLFGAWVPDEWIKAVFEACEKAPQHRYLFLTKNPVRYEQLHQKGILKKADNMWYGYSVTTSGTEKGHYWYSDKYNVFVSVEPMHAPLFTPFADWVIIGAETGNRKDKIIPKKRWINDLCKGLAKTTVPIFMKNSLIPVVGEENMRREFPWEVNHEKK